MYELAHATVEEATLTVQNVSQMSNVTRIAVESLPRSRGCVKKVAKQLALPPNQNG
jgi:hypothetical protein